MTHLLGEKSLDCMVFIALNSAELDKDEPTFRYAAISERWELLCAKWSAKAVWAKLDELCARGYIDCGVSVRSGWLTQEGIDKLREYAEYEHGGVTEREGARLLTAGSSDEGDAGSIPAPSATEAA